MGSGASTSTLKAEFGEWLQSNKKWTEILRAVEKRLFAMRDDPVKCSASMLLSKECGLLDWFVSLLNDSLSHSHLERIISVLVWLPSINVVSYKNEFHAFEYACSYESRFVSTLMNLWKVVDSDLMRWALGHLFGVIAKFGTTQNHQFLTRHKIDSQTLSDMIGYSGGIKNTYKEHIAIYRDTVLNSRSCKLDELGNLSVLQVSILLFNNVSTFTNLYENTAQTRTLENIAVDYLHFPDLVSMRNTCTRLHNITLNLRLNWRIFYDINSEMLLNRSVYLFVKWARIGEENTAKISPDKFSLRDCNDTIVCSRYLEHAQCINTKCLASHKKLCYDRKALSNQQAYVELNDFLFLVASVFDTKFVWTYELYIVALFKAFSVEIELLRRVDAMSRRNEVVREVTRVEARVLYYPRYLELMTLLNEQEYGVKDLHDHKLFCRKPRSAFAPKYPMCVEELDTRLVPDWREQYDKGIDVPFKKTKGIHVLTVKGMEDAERKEKSAIREHVDVFQKQTDRAANLINSLFR